MSKTLDSPISISEVELIQSFHHALLDVLPASLDEYPSKMQRNLTGVSPEKIRNLTKRALDEGYIFEGRVEITRGKGKNKRTTIERGYDLNL